VHSRDQLAGLFWGELNDQKARHCLNTALWRLKQVLAGLEGDNQAYLRIDGETIGFNTASNVWLDVAEFEAHCKLAKHVEWGAPVRQAELYRQAVALYGADLMLDCYEDWCLFERERLGRLYLGALGQLLTFHSQRQEYDAAIDCALRVLACDPLREEVHRDLIQLYLDAHQPAAALRQYRVCDEALRRDLGVDPMPETQALLRCIVGPVRVAYGESGDEEPADASSVVDLAGRLNAALESLHRAVATFESAHTQLVEATVRVEAVANGLSREVRSSPAEPEKRTETGVAQLQQARRLIAESMQHLEGARELSSA
jgi:DNA-binding SARP family transcriptional activator